MFVYSVLSLVLGVVSLLSEHCLWILSVVCYLTVGSVLSVVLVLSQCFFSAVSFSVLSQCCLYVFVSRLS